MEIISGVISGILIFLLLFIAIPIRIMRYKRLKKEGEDLLRDYKRRGY